MAFGRETVAFCPECRRQTSTAMNLVNLTPVFPNFPFCSLEHEMVYKEKESVKQEHTAWLARRTSQPRLMILGYARHGKDTVAELLAKAHGLKHISSSLFVAEKAVRPALALQGITYPDLDSCYADRVNHRAAWKQAIVEYNTPDKARLARELFADFDMYVGLRDLEEFVAAQAAGLFDVCIWVDSTERLAKAHRAVQPWELSWQQAVDTVREPRSSCTVTPNLADIVIDNNYDLAGLALQCKWAWGRACAMYRAGRQNP